VTLRQGAAAADAGSLLVVGKSLVALHNWTFLLGPGFADGIGTGLILGWVMYRSGLVSRRMALFGVIGGPLLAASGIAVLLGVIPQGSAVQGIATVPEIIWEAFLGLWLTFKGFKSSAVPHPRVGSPRSRRHTPPDRQTPPARKDPGAGLRGLRLRSPSAASPPTRLVLDRSPILGRTVTETGRLETFADGVFAIAITLLVLAIRLPDPREDLGSALLRQWPEFVGYLVSFFTIGIMWVQHHRLFTLIRRSNSTFAMINVIFSDVHRVRPFSNRRAGAASWKRRGRGRGDPLLESNDDRHRGHVQRDLALRLRSWRSSPRGHDLGLAASGGAELSVRRADLRLHHPARAPQSVSQPGGIWSVRRLLGAPIQRSND
jgi:hypothetical protein